jgi:Co/Zn/Cd efflux system component
MSLVAIVSVFVFEFTAGLFTNSLALITDSTHALLDAVVTAILIIAVRLALKPKKLLRCATMVIYRYYCYESVASHQ